ncbi:MAG: 4-(cytidine 5'-diphospho)-2-C-methyl-D-erythritol kinase [Candidatus Eisenbacteria bacterium]|uniref:4-diphosphocytidyl-2-C-methyl-D-erythritol kinase n=1 Tax=Eiseniibacteriota bacterium TaxID=2212470 RepID=A0A538T7N2_UNCEI|nr:MAG: 4-(cytidine 5'-diphospho)-2-C-methyl-D-erythritol kinase [Candidatus Eisenbacteria bacterium]
MAAPHALRVRCPAKINLGLWILGRRPDGYHEVDTILQSVSLEDELLLEEARHGLELEARGIRIPKSGANIIERAWSLIGERARNKLRGVRVRLTKRIPIGAGLGGGSSDAAGFLLGVNRLLALGFVDAQLREMASALGADVPFFLRGGTARGRGRGDEVRHLCPLPGAWIVLATPPIAVSTTWAYGRARIRLTPPGTGASILAAAIERQDWGSISELLHNDFEDVVLPDFEVVARVRRSLRGGGVLGSLLSGSGSTVFGLALTQDGAQRAAERAAAAGATIHVVRTTERGVALAGSP